MQKIDKVFYDSIIKSTLHVCLQKVKIYLSTEKIVTNFKPVVFCN